MVNRCCGLEGGDGGEWGDHSGENYEEGVPVIGAWQWQWEGREGGEEDIQVPAKLGWKQEVAISTWEWAVKEKRQERGHGQGL